MPLVPIADSVRAKVEAAMRGGRQTISAIAAETGVSVVTIRAWNRRHRWRPTTASCASGFDPSHWKAPRRAALARLYRQPWVEIGDLAVALGAPRREAEALFQRCGLEGRRPGDVGSAPDSESGSLTFDGPTHPALRALIRSHIARQIVRFDAALAAEAGGDPKGFDSARVLRDLGGLKRLLDEIDEDARAEAGATHTAVGTNAVTGAGDGAAFGGDSGAGATGDDLPALRAEIARRLEALCGERPDAGAAGEPAAAPDPGAGG